MRELAILCPMLTCACTGTQIVEIDSPELPEGTQSLFVLFEIGGDRVAFAIEPGTDSADLPTFNSDSPDGDVELIASPRPRTIPVGPIARGSGEFTTSLAELAGSEASSWRGRIRQGSFDGFEPSPGRMSTARSFLLSFESPCPEFVVHVLSSDEVLTGAIVPFDEASAMAVSTAGVLRVTKGGFAPLPEVGPVRARSGVRLADGRWVLVADDDRIWVGSLESGFDLVPFAEPRDRGDPGWSVVTGEDRIAFLTTAGWVMTFDVRTSSLAVVANEPLVRVGSEVRGWARSLSFDGGRLATTYVHRPTVELYDAERKGSASTTIEEGVGVATSTWVEGLGLVAALAGSGRAARFDSDLWALLGEADRTPNQFGIGACVMSPLHSAAAEGEPIPGFIIAGTGGWVLPYVDGYGFCEAVPVAREAIHRVVPVGDDYLLSLDVPAGEDDRHTLVWLERAR